LANATDYAALILDNGKGSFVNVVWLWLRSQWVYLSPNAPS